MSSTCFCSSGQALPDGELSTATKLIVLFTSFFSVPIVAMPTAMLTWGFEGEAARLAARLQRSVERQQAYGTSQQCDVWSDDGSDSSSDFEEYLRTTAGTDEDEAEAAEEALRFFASEGANGVVGGGGEGLEDGGSRLLARAQQLAHDLDSKHHRKAFERHVRADALHLVEASLDKADGPEMNAMEERLRRFASFVSQEAKPVETAEDQADKREGGEGGGVEARLSRLEASMAGLQQSFSVALADLKADQSNILRAILQHGVGAEGRA